MTYGFELKNAEGHTLVNSTEMSANFGISQHRPQGPNNLTAYWYPALQNASGAYRSGTGQGRGDFYLSDHPNALIFARPSYASSSGSSDGYTSSDGLTHNDLGFGFVVSRSFHGSTVISGVEYSEMGVWYGHTSIDFAVPSTAMPLDQGGGKSFDAILSGGSGSVIDSGGTTRNFTYPAMPEAYLTVGGSTGGFAEVGRRVGVNPGDTGGLVILKLTPGTQDLAEPSSGEYGLDVRGDSTVSNKLLFSATRSKLPIILAIGEVPHGKEFVYEVPKHTNSLYNIDYKKIFGFMGNTESYNVRTFASGPYTSNSTSWGTEQYKKVKRVQYTFYPPNQGNSFKNNGTTPKIGIRNMEHYQYADTNGKYPDANYAGGDFVEKSGGQALPYMLIYNPWDDLQTGESSNYN